MSDRCPDCDRADCPDIAASAKCRALWVDLYMLSGSERRTRMAAAKQATADRQVAKAVCRAHRVNWRARFLALAEAVGRLPEYGCAEWCGRFDDDPHDCDCNVEKANAARDETRRLAGRDPT